MTEKQIISEWKRFINPHLTLEQYKEIRSQYNIVKMNKIVAEQLIAKGKMSAVEQFPSAVKAANPVYDTAERTTMSNRIGCMLKNV